MCLVLCPPLSRGSCILLAQPSVCAGSLAGFLLKNHASQKDGSQLLSIAFAVASNLVMGASDHSNIDNLGEGLLRHMAQPDRAHSAWLLSALLPHSCCYCCQL